MGKTKLIASMLVAGLLMLLAVSIASAQGAAAPAKTPVKTPAKPAAKPAPTAPKAGSGDIVGVVYGVNISKAEVVSTLVGVYGNQFRDLLMDQALIKHEAKKLGLAATNADVDAKLAEIGARLQNTTVKDRVAEMGMDWNTFYESQRLEVLKDKIIKQRLLAEVKPEDLDTFHAYHILLRVAGDTPDEKAKNEEDAKKKIEEIKGKITDLASFNAQAKESSQDTGNAEKGGDLGEFGRGVMVKEFEDAIVSGPLNAVIGPVKTSFGYHLIWVDKKTVGSSLKNTEIAAAKAKKVDEMYQRRGPQEQQKLIQDLRDAATKSGDYKKPGSFVAGK